MAHVVERFHRFTCTPSGATNHTCLCLPSRSWSSFTDPGRIEGWVGLGTTILGKQSAQDRYVTEVAVVSCSNRYASLGSVGSCSAVAMSAELTTCRKLRRWPLSHRVSCNCWRDRKRWLADLLVLNRSDVNTAVCCRDASPPPAHQFEL